MSDYVEEYICKEYGTIRNGQPSAPGMDCVQQQKRGQRPAKRTPKGIKMGPCVFWKTFGAWSAPGLPTGSCATTFWTSFSSQMGTQSGPRPAKRTPKGIKMRPCVCRNAFGARSAPRLRTGSCATTFWTSFCSQMGTQWGSIFDPGLTSTASLANLARIEKGVKKH